VPSQTRWLHTLFIKCLQNRELSSTMFALAQAALLGNYTHVTGERAAYATRKAFIDSFTQATAADMFNSLPPHEHLVLYIMGTYLLTILPLCPALERLVSAMSPFQSQAQRVFDALHAVRTAGRDNWQVMFSDEVLETLKKTHKRMPKRKLVPRGLSDASNSLVVSATRTAARRGIKRHGVAVDAEYFELLAANKRPVTEWTPDGNFSGAAAELLGEMERDPTKAPVVIFSQDTIGDAALARLVDFAAAADLAHVCRTTPLPERFVQAQMAAVARRFGTDDPDAMRRATTVIVCVNCGPRNFYLTQAERSAASRRVDNVRAAGYRKLALDMTTGELRCVATEACMKHRLIAISGGSESLPGPPDAAAARGGIVALRDVALVLSPCCGHLCATCSIRVTPTGMDCPACCTARKDESEQTPDPRICAHCSKRSQLRQAMEQTVLLRDAHGRVQKYGFCRSHLRRWARTQSGYLTLDFVSRNMTNRHGNGLVLDPN